MDNKISNLNDSMINGFSNINADVNRKIEELKKYVENNVGVAFDTPVYIGINSSGYAYKSGIVFGDFYEGGIGFINVGGFIMQTDTTRPRVTIPISKGQYYHASSIHAWIFYFK